MAWVAHTIGLLPSGLFSSARQWVFRLRYSDSARPALIGAYMDDIVGLG